MQSVLSRVRRFLFWSLLLLVGAYVVWGRIEAWRLSRAVAAIQARGEPIDYSYWYARQVTAEQREVASLYARAADFATEAESGQQYRAAQREAFAARLRAPVPNRRGFLDMFMNPMWYSTVSFEAARLDLAARRIMTTVLAVERYRRAHLSAVPPSLDALVPAFLTAVPEDPFSQGAGQPIRYRSDPDGYVIYSIDSNRRDDGGALYGHGAAVAKHVGQQSPRDFGIRVPQTLRD